MPNYDWMDDVWKGQAAAAEDATGPILLPGKLVDDKRWFYENAVQNPLAPWPLIPRTYGGEKVPFGGQPAIRVFLLISDDPKAQVDPAKGAIRVKLPQTLIDEDEVGLTADDDFLVVPWTFWRWLTNVRKFESSVIAGVPRRLHPRERCFTHKDAEEEWGSTNWIVPLKKKEQALYYAILSTIGVFPTHDPAKGNPDLFAPLKESEGADPNQPTTWWIVRKIFQQGIESWGEYATGHDGADEIYQLRALLINHLRGQANACAEEELQRARRRDGFGQRDILKAFGDDLYRFLPEEDRTALEDQLLTWEHEEVYLPRVDRLVFKGRRGYSPGEVAKQIMSGYGEHLGVEEADFRAGQMLEWAWLCSIGDVLASVGRMKVMKKSKGDIAEEVQKAYIAGKISSLELAALDTTVAWPTERGANDAFLEKVYAELRKWFDRFLSDEYREEVRNA